MRWVITVAARKNDGSGVLSYELACDQIRLETFKALKHEKIPAVAITASSEDCLAMNLVENLARRQHHSLDLLRDIKRLKDSRYSEHEIAAKTPLSMKYVHGVIRLLESHEHRLLRAGATPKKIKGISREQLEIMETESANLEREVRLVEDNYGSDHLDLVLTGGYVARLVSNGRITKYLALHHKDFLPEFEKIAEREVFTP